MSEDQYEGLFSLTRWIWSIPIHNRLEGCTRDGASVDDELVYVHCNDKERSSAVGSRDSISVACEPMNVISLTERRATSAENQ